MLTLLRQLSLRHILRTPFRALLVVLGIALGVALQVATRATSDSLVVTFEKMVEQVSGKADVTIRGGGGGLPGEMTAELVDIEGIEHASALVEITLRDTATDRPLLILGVDFLGDPYFLPFDVEEGEKNVVEDPLAFANDPHAILISKTLAARRGLAVGDALELRGAEGPAEFHIKGILDDSGPAAAFDGQVAVMFLDAAQVAFARGRTVDRIEVAFAPGADRDRVLAQLTEIVGARGEVELPEARRQRVVKLLGPIRTVLALSGVLALVVAMFLIYNAVGIAVAQRQTEVGVIRALGGTRARVLWMFCAEAMLLAIPGSAIGVLLGRFFARYAVEQTAPSITQLYLPLKPPVPQIDLDLVVQAVVAGLVAALLAAWLPARRAANIDPALSVRSRSVATSDGRLPHRGMALGGLLLAALIWVSTKLASVPVGVVASILALGAAALLAPLFLVSLRAALTRPEVPLGASAKLGLVNVNRDLGRSAINVVALTAAVTVSVTLGIWIASMQRSVTDWFEDSLAGDLVVTAGSPMNDQYNIPFGEDALGKVRSVDGVEAALPYRFLSQTYDGLDFMLSAFDTRLHADLMAERGEAWTVVDGGDPIAPGELATDKRVLLSESAARHLGVKAGDPIDLSTPQGAVPFEVRAIIGDYFLDRPAILIDRKYLGEYFDDRSIDSIDLFVDKGASLDTVGERAREALGGGEALFVTRAGDLRRRLVDTVSESFRYGRSIELVTLLVALMGVMGTMLSVVLDRTRELGVLRAIGASGRQVAAAVTAEAAALGFAAAALGILCGALQGVVILDSIVAPGAEWNLDYVFPVATVVRVGALVLLTATIAGLLPAYRASRIDIKTALNYE